MYARITQEGFHFPSALAAAFANSVRIFMFGPMCKSCVYEYIHVYVYVCAYVFADALVCVFIVHAFQHFNTWYFPHSLYHMPFFFETGSLYH